MQRKLSSIQKILKVEPISGADSIEAAGVLGWQVVVKKGEFKPGDLCVYCEIDSVLPEKPEFEFLRERKFRIKTVRLRGQISQGICFPLTLLPQNNSLKEGDDLTELLNITKYEPPVPLDLGGSVKGRFPEYIPKTDETRIQSEPGLLAEFAGKECYISMKIDGTSATFSNYNGEIDVCSHNLSLNESETNVFWQVYRKLNLEKVLKTLGNFAIQGELAGPKIQKNRLNLKAHELFVFNIYDIDRKRFLDFISFSKICSEHGLRTVPVISTNVIFNFTIEQLLEMAKGVYEGTANQREGIVIRPMTESCSNILYGRLSVKVLNNEFLLKE